MKYFNFLITALIISIALVSCRKLDSNSNNIKSIEQKIYSKVKQDGPHLAHLETIYGIVFTNQAENWIQSDDIYIRRDRASVFYGYDLDNAEIRVIEGNGQNILQVKLPTPKQISIDRMAVSIDSAHEDYKPKDKEGTLIDVDKKMNGKLDEIVKIYEGKSIEMIKKISQQYFESLSKRFNLQLDLEFSI